MMQRVMRCFDEMEGWAARGAWACNLEEKGKKEVHPFRSCHCTYSTLGGPGGRAGGRSCILWRKDQSVVSWFPTEESAGGGIHSK